MPTKHKKLSPEVIERITFLKNRKKKMDYGILALQIIEKGMGFVNKILAYEAAKLLELEHKDEIETHLWMYKYHKNSIRKELLLKANSIFFKFKKIT